MFAPLLEVEMLKKCRPSLGSQNVQNTPCSEHFWKLRCSKSIRRFCAKHTSKSTCTEHLTLGNIFGEVDVEKVHTAVARRTFSKSKCTMHHKFAPRHFWKLRCSKVNAVVARSTFRCQKCQKLTVSRATFGRSDAVSHGRRRGLCTLPKWANCDGFVAVSTAATTALHSTLHNYKYDYNRNHNHITLH